MLNADCRSAVGIARGLRGDAHPTNYNTRNTLAGWEKLTPAGIGSDVRWVFWVNGKRTPLTTVFKLGGFDCRK